MSALLPSRFLPPYPVSPSYQQPVAYFCMEYALDQSLKIYSGGLGFLAGSHMRSAYELKQNMIGIGILWSYGYYDQVRNDDNTLRAQFRRKSYNFLQDTGILFSITIHNAPVWVRAYFLPPDRFRSAPLFLLTTDIPENDFLARSTTFKLYDSNAAAKIAQCMVLGIGGFRLLEELGYEPAVYHLNEAHALPVAFQLYRKYGDVEAVKRHMVFTTHTPEEAGNEKHPLDMLDNMGFFGTCSAAEVRKITGMEGDIFNHSLAALRMSKKANAVSKLHGEVSRKMWEQYDSVCPIIHITNTQNAAYWADPEMEAARLARDKNAVFERKKTLKRRLLEEVADQTGKWWDEHTLTIVWARRFAAYKRPDLIARDIADLEALLNNPARPVQIIWAGKPYPTDQVALDLFNQLVELSADYPGLAVLTGYELRLSKLLKDGSDIWLNTPIVTREASGTSGMTAAMNGGVNLSTDDGWIREFARHGKNCFIAPVAPANLEADERDEYDRSNLLRILNEEILPLYYNKPAHWAEIQLAGMNDVHDYFESSRMADEYYRFMYTA